MRLKQPSPFKPSSRPLKTQKQGNPVPKRTQVAGRRIGGAQRAEFARHQARRDAKR